jgi:hypothetical protein
MSDGHYCFVRDLGPVKGGKGMRHHEVVIDFSRRGMVALLRRVLAGPRSTSQSQDALDYRIPLREPSPR